MEERYQIRLAFKANKETPQYKQSTGHYFWQLIQEEIDANGELQSIPAETFYAFPVSKAVEAQASAKSFNITIPASFLFPKKWKVYCFEGDFHKTYPFSVKPDYTQIIYGHASDQIDAKNRWEQAKANLQKLDINIPNPKSIALGDVIRNGSYHALAEMMELRPYYSQDYLSNSTVSLSSQTLTNSSQLNLSTDKSPPPLVTYEIHAAVYHIFIEIFGWRLYSFPWPIGHHFYVLVENRDGQKTMVESIHGFATRFQADQYGNLSPRLADVVGTWSSTIKFYILKPSSTQEKNLMDARLPSWVEPGQTHPIYKEQDALARWEYIKNLIGKLNELEKRYSFCGYGKGFFSFFKGCNFKSLDSVNSNNSNTAYALIAILLGIKLHRFKNYVASGINGEMPSKEEMDKLGLNEVAHCTTDHRLST